MLSDFIFFIFYFIYYIFFIFLIGLKTGFFTDWAKHMFLASFDVYKDSRKNLRSKNHFVEFFKHVLSQMVQNVHFFNTRNLPRKFHSELTTALIAAVLYAISEQHMRKTYIHILEKISRKNIDISSCL